MKSLPNSMLTNNSIPEFIRIENWYSSNPLAMQLWPFAFYDVVRNKHHWCRLKNFTFLALEFVLDGDVYFEQGGEIDVVKPGEIYLIQKADESLMKTGPSGHYKKLTVIIRGNLLDALLSGMNLNKKFKVKLSNPTKIEQLMREIGELITIKNIEDISHITGLAFELLSCLSGDASEKNDIPETLSAAVQMLEANVGKRFSVKELAKTVKCSCATLNRQFNTYYHMSPNAYQIKLRMTYAGQLVSSSNMMIKEIADMLGYQNQMYFSNDFKNYFKVSPSTYRQQNQGNIADNPAL